jgi:hypothetical protein
VSGLAWGDSPYDGKTPREVIDDYVLIRGDLGVRYARVQLAEWIDRYAEAHTAPLRAEVERQGAVLAAVKALLPGFEADYGINSSPVTRLHAALTSAPEGEQP